MGYFVLLIPKRSPKWCTLWTFPNNYLKYCVFPGLALAHMYWIKVWKFLIKEDKTLIPFDSILFSERELFS